MLWYEKKLWRRLVGKKAEYEKLMQNAVTSFFTAHFSQNEGTFIVDLTPLKEDLLVRVPAIIEGLPPCRQGEIAGNGQFRVCAKEPVEQFKEETRANLVTAIEKELPARISLFKFDAAQSRNIPIFIQNTAYVRSTFLLVIQIVIVTGLGLVALIIFSPWKKVLAWIGASLAALAVYNGFFIFSLQQVPEARAPHPLL